MTIELHTWNTPNGRKISVALEEMGLPYKVFPINITKGEQMAPAFLAISPNNKIPAIVDPDGPGGKRVSIFESGAILLYLGERTGKFLPAPLIERIPVLEWLMWQMGGFGPMPGQVHHFIALENETDRAYGLKRYMTETRRLYGVLDRRLADREFVAERLDGAARRQARHGGQAGLTRRVMPRHRVSPSASPMTGPSTASSHPRRLGFCALRRAP